MLCVGADDSVRPWEAANSPKIFAFRKCIGQGGQSRPPLRNSDYINTNATGLSSSEEGLFLTLVHRIFLNMSLYIHWKHGIICEVSRCGCLCPFARRTMAQYPSQPAGFEEGPKNPLKGTSVKPLVSASYAQSGVDAGGRQFCLRRPGAFQWHEMSDPPAVETGSRAAAYSLCGLNDRCTVPA